MSNKKTLTNLMCTLGLVMAGGVIASQGALAHDHDDMKKGDEMFMKMDTNHDGMISPAENAAHAQQMFTMADTNHDGMVSRDEMMAMHKSMHEEHEKMEHNGMRHDDSAMDAAERDKKKAKEAAEEAAEHDKK